MYRFTMVSAAAIVLTGCPAFAQAPENEGRPDDIIVTAARSTLPANALPLTVDVISKVSLDQQAAISGSVVDAVASLTLSVANIFNEFYIDYNSDTQRGGGPQNVDVTQRAGDNLRYYAGRGRVFTLGWDYRF